jgi:ADP-ribosyl-[dinitrogen reductase] hydrolase
MAIPLVQLPGGAEALFGIPDEIADNAWKRLPEDMRQILTELYERTGQSV